MSDPLHKITKKCRKSLHFFGLFYDVIVGISKSNVIFEIENNNTNRNHATRN